jgi:hypothetical protein
MNLPTDLSDAIDKQENNFCNTLTARQVLESALTYQFRVIADGILAHLLLQKRTFNNLDWWCQYLCKKNTVKNYLPNLNNLDFIQFKKQFVKDVALRQIRPLKPTDLTEIKIRILGGEVNLWQEGRINRQLINLGSSLRLLVLDSHLARLNCFRELMKKPPKSIDVNRFIFGKIAPISVFAGAALFNFEHEHAVSPHIPGNAGGLTNLSRIVIRQIVQRMKIESTVGTDNNSSEEFEEKLQTHLLYTLLHESFHIDQFSYQMSSQSALKSWIDAIREDICRFTQIPRSVEEIRKTFEEIFSISLSRNFQEFSIPGAQHGYSLENEITKMLADMVLIKNCIVHNLKGGSNGTLLYYRCCSQ